VTDVCRQRTAGALCVVMASDGVVVSEEMKGILGGLRTSQPGMQAAREPLVVQVPVDAVSVGATILASSGGTGRCLLSNDLGITFRDVLANPIAVDFKVGEVGTRKVVFAAGRR